DRTGVHVGVAGVRIGTGDDQRAGDGLRPSRATVDLQHVLQRAGLQVQVRDRPARGAEIVVLQVERATVQHDGARAAATDDIATNHVDGGGAVDVEDASGGAGAGADRGVGQLKPARIDVQDRVAAQRD